MKGPATLPGSTRTAAIDPRSGGTIVRGTARARPAAGRGRSGATLGRAPRCWSVRTDRGGDRRAGVRRRSTRRRDTSRCAARVVRGHPDTEGIQRAQWQAASSPDPGAVVPGIIVGITRCGRRAREEHARRLCRRGRTSHRRQARRRRPVVLDERGLPPHRRRRAGCATTAPASARPRTTVSWPRPARRTWARDRRSSRTVDRRAAGDPGPAHDERHPDVLVVRGLLPGRQAVLAEMEPVVGTQEDVGVGELAGPLQRRRRPLRSRSSTPSMSWSRRRYRVSMYVEHQRRQRRSGAQPARLVVEDGLVERWWARRRTPGNASA